MEGQYFVKEIFREEKSRERFRRSKSLCELPKPHRLRWNLNQFLKQNISLAKESLTKYECDALIQSIAIHISLF